MRLETHVLPIAVCKSCRIRHSPNSGTVRRFPVLPTPCAKTAKSCAFCDSRHCVFLCKGKKLQNSAQAEFWDCTPVLAFDTGGLWLWLGAFEKSGLYRCQSAPGPPMPVFFGTELRFGIEIPLIYATALCQNPRIRRSRILRQYAGFLWRDLVLAFGKARQTLLFAK